MSRVVDNFPPRGGKMILAEPLLEELMDGLIHEFTKGEDWPDDTSPKEMRMRLGNLAAQHGFKVRTAVRGNTIVAKIIAEADRDDS